MGTAARDWVWRLAVSPPQKLVLLALAEHANAAGECWPSLTRLATLTGCARSTVAKALAALASQGLIVRDRGGPNRATRYRLDIDATPGDERSGSSENESVIVRKTDNSSTESGPGMVRETDGGSPKSGPGVVRETDGPSPGNKPGVVRATDCDSPADGRMLVRETDTNRQLNRHKTTTTSSCARTRKDAPKGNKATRIPPDWQPSERILTWAEARGMTRAWVGKQVAEFVVYWGDQGTRRKSWDATFMNRLRQLFEHTATETDHASRETDDQDYNAGATPLEAIPWMRSRLQ